MVYEQNREIVERYLKSGLIRTCVECQFAKLKMELGKQQFKEDMFQDLYLILMEYNPEKLKNADENNHMNALITRILINNLWSNSSQFKTRYLKLEYNDLDDLINKEDDDE